jgi:hypothetical protein
MQAPPLNQQDPNEIPPWVNILQGMESRIEVRLCGIDRQLKYQGVQWQTLETLIKTQNSRITSIEQQVQDINKVKNAVTKSEHHVKMLDEKLQCQTNQIHEYQNSI